MRKYLPLIVVAILLYVVSYLGFRTAYQEVRQQDGKVYVIFPPQYPALYYFFRPLSLLDGAITGMQFHIGPHEQAPEAG